MSTMKDERNIRWLPVMFFMLTGVIIGVSLYLITASAVETEARAHGGNTGLAATAPTTANGAASQFPVVLRKDVKTRLGKVDLIYRGLEKGNLRLDVFIRDLDPDYPYRRQIDRHTARDGFRLGGVRFVLVSAGRSKAKLVWFRGG